MYKLKKGELIAAIEEFGETPPPKWTVPELRTRLLQLQEEHGVSQVKKQKTDMRQWVVRLNTASKKKAELQEFCRRELGQHVSGNETIAQLQKEAMVKIYQVSVPDPQDPVGFGKAASLTYEEVQQDQQYCQWVKTTWKEGGQTSPQLARLAQWLIAQDQPRPEITQDVKMLKTVKEPEITAKAKAVPKKPMDKIETGYAESTASSSSTQMMLVVMQQMMETMKELKEEVAELHEDRPRKKNPYEKNSDTYSVVSHPERPVRFVSSSER